MQKREILLRFLFFFKIFFIRFSLLPAPFQAAPSACIQVPGSSCPAVRKCGITPHFSLSPFRPLSCIQRSALHQTALICNRLTHGKILQGEQVYPREENSLLSLSC